MRFEYTFFVAALPDLKDSELNIMSASQEKILSGDVRWTKRASKERPFAVGARGPGALYRSFTCSKTLLGRLRHVRCQRSVRTGQCWQSQVVALKVLAEAEAYTSQVGVEDGNVFRAAASDMFGALDLKRLEASAAKFAKQICFTYCQSLEEAVKNPKCSNHLDTPLSIKKASLGQDLRRKKGEETGDPHEEDHRANDDELADSARWKDTDLVVAVTEVKEPTKLVHVDEDPARRLHKRKGNPKQEEPYKEHDE